MTPTFDVYESIVVCHKPAGLPSTPSEKSRTKSAVDYAIEKFPELLKIKGAQPTDYGLLHRLDNGTSGLLIFAKNQEEFDHLKEEWNTGNVKKIYHAIVKGHPPLQTIKFPIGHSAKSTKRMIVIENPPSKFLSRIRGKPQEALTEIIKSIPISKKYSELEIEIKTGVRHQIRAHLEAIGHPILGDVIYHGDSSPRMWLHSYKLELTLKNGEKMKLESPAFKDLNSELKSPETSELD